MKKMISLLRCDFANSRRDSILLYVILSPVLLAVGISLFVPSTGGAGVTFAVGPNVREVLTLVMVMLASLIGGMTIGFNIVEERSNRITNALAVTPIKLRTYLGAKAVFAGSLGLFVSVCLVVIILGFRLPWGRLLLAVVLSTMMAALFGYAMGRLAENQISALGLMKILMPAYLTIPLVSIFVPTQIHWVFVIFPQYWLFSAFQALLAPGLAVLAGFCISLTVFVIETALLLTVVGRSMGKVIILRSRGAHG